MGGQLPYSTRAQSLKQSVDRISGYRCVGELGAWAVAQNGEDTRSSHSSR